MKVYSVAIGRLPMTPQFMWKKEVKEAVEIIRQLDGLVAVCPCYPHGNLLLFESKMKAISAKNELDFERIQTGKNICELEWDKEKNELRDFE